MWRRYAACPDITTTVTPDLQGGSDSAPQPSVLLHVDIGGGKRRMGGSALAQVFSQIGDSSPDVDAPVLEAAFRTTQELVKAGTLLAGHDISDGGFITTLLEMCFAGNRGATVAVVQAGATALEAMFAEELYVLPHPRCSPHAQRRAAVLCLRLRLPAGAATH